MLAIARIADHPVLDDIALAGIFYFEFQAAMPFLLRLLFLHGHIDFMILRRRRGMRRSIRSHQKRSEGEQISDAETVLLLFRKRSSASIKFILLEKVVVFTFF